MKEEIKEREIKY